MDVDEALERLDNSDDRQEEGEVLRLAIESLRFDLGASQMAVGLLRKDADIDQWHTRRRLIRVWP